MNTREIVVELRDLAKLGVGSGIINAAADKLKELQQLIDDTTNDHYVDALDFYSERCRTLEDEAEKLKESYPVISKGEFCGVLHKLKENEDFVDEINDVLREFGRDNYIFSTGLEDVIVRLLETVFEFRWEIQKWRCS